jgi:hypothetical protein
MKSDFPTGPSIASGRGALLAGGLAAILASACCLGPLVLFALGISGAWISNLTVCAAPPFKHACKVLFGVVAAVVVVPLSVPGMNCADL